MKIYKYQLEAGCLNRIEMPADSYILNVGEQRGKVVLWAIVVPEKSKVIYEIGVIATGQNFGQYCAYIGTVQMSSGLVWHVFINEATWMGEQ